MASESGGELRIGSALKEARTRAGLDIRTVEDRTKIRTRYLRALESEEWSTLPGHAYVKGFLRTYANLLGLDADALVDEYRRSVEGPQASPVPLGEGVLETRRRLREPGMPRGGGPRRGLIVGALLLVIVAILLVLGLTSSDDGGDSDKKGERKERSQGAKGKGGDEKGQKQPKPKPDPKPQAKTVTMRLVANADGLQICLLRNGSKQPLIDGVFGSAGSEDTFEAKGFELRFPAGYDVSQFDLFVGGKRAKVSEEQGPAAFTIEPPAQVRPADPPGTDCP
jgi:transcriptional regulator with XRE-family HTH domain